MKKITIILLIALCFVFAFVSCDSNGGNSSTPSSIEDGDIKNSYNKNLSAEEKEKVNSALSEAPEINAPDHEEPELMGEVLQEAEKNASYKKVGDSYGLEVFNNTQAKDYTLWGYAYVDFSIFKQYTYLVIKDADGNVFEYSDTYNFG